MVVAYFAIATLYPFKNDKTKQFTVMKIIAENIEQVVVLLNSTRKSTFELTSKSLITETYDEGNDIEIIEWGLDEVEEHEISGKKVFCFSC